MTETNCRCNKFINVGLKYKPSGKLFKLYSFFCKTHKKFVFLRFCRFLSAHEMDDHKSTCLQSRACYCPCKVCEIKFNFQKKEKVAKFARLTLNFFITYFSLSLTADTYILETPLSFID